jgi:excisionase family DNA binding protein
MNEGTAGKPLLTVPEAAALMKVSRSLAYRMFRAGQVPGLIDLPGRTKLVRRAVLEAWLAGDERAA